MLFHSLAIQPLDDFLKPMRACPRRADALFHENNPIKHETTPAIQGSTQAHQSPIS